MRATANHSPADSPADTKAKRDQLCAPIIVTADGFRATLINTHAVKLDGRVESCEGGARRRESLSVDLGYRNGVLIADKRDQDSERVVVLVIRV